MTEPTSDSALFTPKPFLSEVLEVDQFKRGQGNIIVAPCHSGKTTANGKIISTHATAPEFVLCLIDTKAGKQAIITREEATAYRSRWIAEIREEWWGSLRDGDGFRVMTYHQFGMEIQKQPLFFDHIELIICDEMHNLIKYMGMEHSKNRNRPEEERIETNYPCRIALDTLARLAGSPSGPMIVIMSATINPVSVALDRRNAPCTYFDYTDKVRCDIIRNRFYYAHFEDVLQQLPFDTRAIIYTPQITQMLKFAKLADDGWRNICCLWGLNNPNHEMNDEQKRVRDVILRSERIPPEIDLLFINAAYETSINIRNEDFNTVIVHDGNPDVQVQVRGRLRHDIDALYIYDSTHVNIAQYFPAEYYNRWLFREDIEKIVSIMNLTNAKGRKLKWLSIYKLLQKDGVTVSKQKKNGRQCWVLYPAQGVM